MVRRRLASSIGPLDGGAGPPLYQPRPDRGSGDARVGRDLCQSGLGAVALDRAVNGGLIGVITRLLRASRDAVGDQVPANGLTSETGGCGDLTNRFPLAIQRRHLLTNDVSATDGE